MAIKAQSGGGGRLRQWAEKSYNARGHAASSVSDTSRSATSSEGDSAKPYSQKPDSSNTKWVVRHSTWGGR